MRRALFVLFAGLAGPTAAVEVPFWAPAEVQGPYADQRLSTPSDAEVMAAWPAAAAARKTPGNAIAACKADQTGELRACRVMVQRPAGAGFGDALMALVPKYRLKPAKAGDRPTAADVLITASWPIADAPPNWLVQPKPGDFATTGTQHVWNSTTPIRADMNCLLGKLGTLYQCVVVYQDPPGTGFGAMVLRLAPYLKFKPAMLNGQPVAVGLTLPWKSVNERRFPPGK
jgi:hypothetical protein